MSETLQALVVTVLHETKLFASTRTDKVTSDVASQLAEQIGLLPRSLGIAVLLATRVFNLEAIVFHGKTFEHLPQLAQIDHLKRWENSRFAAKRDFTRFFRSLTLFNYYDHAEVRSRI